MKTKRFCLLAAAGLILLGLLAVNSIRAFDYTGAAWCCQNEIIYCINPEEPETVCGPNPRSIIDVVNAAAASWNAQGAAFQLVYGGTTTNRGCEPDLAMPEGFCISPLDGQNVVSMATCPMPPGVLATAFWWFIVNPGENNDCCIFEADICFSQDLLWFKDQDSTACAGSCYDMQSVATHEFGHWASFGHEDDDGVIGFRPVMFFSTAFCEIRRAITADDAAGLAYIYDATGVIVVSQRCEAVHSHPPYAGSPKTPMFMQCDFAACEGGGGCLDADGDGICDPDDNCPANFNPLQEDFDGDGIGDACCCVGMRGDLNGDGTDANILDLTYLVDRIFRGGPPSGCPNEADLNSDGTPANILDLTFLVDRIFRGGSPPGGC